MKFNENMKHAELVTCPSCKTELELDQAESESHRYTCPECGAEVDITERSFSKATSVMIQERKIHVSVSDRIDLWLMPFPPFLAGFLMLSSVGFNSSLLIIFPIAFIGLGIFYTYRALVSDKLTFIPSNDPISHKIAIVSTLQEKFQWKLTREKDGAFLFTGKSGFGFSRREIRLICTHDGYYLNCWHLSSGHLSGVSIIDTTNVIDAINELTSLSNTLENQS